MAEFIKDWTKILLTAGVTVLVITQFLMPTNIYGTSMEPAFSTGDYLFVDRQAYNQYRLPQRGDVILFKSDLLDEKGKKKILIKRVIGLPGDTISVNRGEVYLNNEILTEDYTKEGYTTGHVEPLMIPEDGYFCMGDNRVRSRDSRDDAVGIVDAEDIVGKVIFRIYPLDKFGKIENIYEEEILNG